MVATTTCDQMRHVAGLIAHRGQRPVFLLDVPATWQTPVARRMYLDELKRLGRFLVQLGGSAPSPQELAGVMLESDDARAALRASPTRTDGPEADGIALAIVGGPLLEQDYQVFEWVRQAGGRVVLDATEGGQRTTPAVFDRRRLREDPLAELADAYFGGIRDAFRRPNHRLYEWLAREMLARQVRGVLLLRYVWCDIWHAELHRLKQHSRVPVLDVDLGHDDGSFARTMGRIEAFLEMCRTMEGVDASREMLR